MSPCIQVSGITDDDEDWLETDEAGLEDITVERGDLSREWDDDEDTTDTDWEILHNNNNNPRHTDADTNNLEQIDVDEDKVVILLL